MIWLICYRKVILLPLLLIFSLLALGQSNYAVSGKVIDADTREPLAFVNIIINQGRTGGSTDIDGKFSFVSSEKIKTLTMTYVGYQTLIIPIHEDLTKGLLIKLKKKQIELAEVVIYPTENPAHRIINLVIKNRDRNNPEKMKSFSYTSYEKTIFTAMMDTLNMADSLKNDSSYLEVKEFFNKQDIGIMETVTERKFLHPDRNYENVKANRISGFRDPIFVFMISQLQSTNFYGEMFHIMDKHYVNPISKGSTSKYFFLIEDTTYTELNDTVFIISYRPRRNTNFDGLEGVLYINSHGWAIQNVIARPAKEEGFAIKIQHKYELINGEQWFPVQINNDIIFNNVGIQAGEAPMKLIGIGKSYIKDIVLNPDLVKRQFDVLGVDVDPDSHKKPEKYWNTYRVDSLSERNRRTYAFMDSIGKAEKFDKLAKTMEALIRGKIPWKFLDFDLDKIIKYNGYQGFYLGIGIHTNDVLSRRFKVGGYVGYGFKDFNFKYGLDASYILNRRREFEVRVGYFCDLTEAGGVSFMFDKTMLFSGQNWRKLLINRMNPTVSTTAGASVRVLRDIMLGLDLSSSFKRSAYDYMYGYSDNGVAILTNEFNFTEVRLGLRFAFREEFIVTKRTRVSLGTDYPILWFQYTRGINGFLNGEFAYDRFDIKIEKSFYFKYLGESSFLLKGGLILGEVPYCNLYNGNGSYRIVTIYAANSFATMRMNEFLSDRYIALYYTHNFGKLLFQTKKFQPEFMVATSLGFGALNSNGEIHQNITYKTMNLGYYESGLLVNNMLNLQFLNLGLGVFYRYGPYSMEKTGDNFAYKFSIVFPFDF